MNTLPENDSELYKKAEARVQELKGFYSHLTTFILVISGLAILNWFTSPDNWWIIWPILGWGIFGIGSHALNTFGSNVMFGKEWEERKIKEEMEKMRK